MTSLNAAHTVVEIMTRIECRDHRLPGPILTTASVLLRLIISRTSGFDGLCTLCSL